MQRKYRSVVDDEHNTAYDEALDLPLFLYLIDSSLKGIGVQVFRINAPFLHTHDCVGAAGACLVIKKT